jgi:cell division protein FtsB
VERPIYRFLHLIFALGIVHLLVLSGLEVQRFLQTQNDLQAQQAKVGQLQQEVQILKAEVAASQNPGYREALVRRMGFVKRGEILIHQ